jgi:hypothetical protein
MTAGMPQIGLELAAQHLKMVLIRAATHKLLGILGTHPLDRENGGKKWVESGGNRKTQKQQEERIYPEH